MRAHSYFFFSLLVFFTAPARAETIIRSTWQASFLGLPVSRSFITLTLSDNSYRFEGTGRASAVAALIAPTTAKLDAGGTIGAGTVKPESFSAHITAGADKYDIELELKNGAVLSESATPPAPKPDLVPVTDAMKRNVIDPLSAFLIPASPEKTCARTLPVYTGRERFDLALSFGRKEKVSVPGLYEGEAVVCSVRFIPHGGHRAKKKEVRYMIDNKDMEAWFVPLPQAGLMGLYKVHIGTKLGPLTIEIEKAGLGPAPGKKT